MDSQNSSRFKKPEILTLSICLIGLLAAGYEIFLSKKRSDDTKQSVLADPMKPLGSEMRSNSGPEGNLSPTSGDIHIFKPDPHSQAKTKPVKPTRKIAAEESPEETLAQQIEPPWEAKEIASATEMTVPFVSLKEKQKDFWFWLGLGENFLYYQQTVPSISGSFKFQNAQGPTLLLTSGFKASDQWGGEFSYKETPGKMNSSKSIHVDKGSFTWKTTTGEAFYYLDGTDTFVRTGFQYHVMPFMQMDKNTDLLDIQDNTLMTFSLGFQKNFRLKEKLRGEWVLRYQHPITAGSTTGDSFSVTPELAFDGSLGMVYLYDDCRRYGIYWYGQYHQYQFNYESASENSSGRQVLFYSNIEFRLGWEF